MKASKPCAGHLIERGGYYHTVIYVLENGKRKPVSRTTGLPVKNNLRKAQKIPEERKREYDEMGLSGMLSMEERDRFSSMPLADYMHYVVGKKSKLQPSTRAGYVRIIDGPITRFFTPKGVTLASLTPKQIDDFIETMNEDGLSEATQGDYVRLLNTCLRYALRKDHIMSNPMDKVERPAKGKSKALFYGLRRSEVCGLQWDSIDWDNNRIHIDHKAYHDTLKEGRPIIISDEMKTESSRRTLPLIPFVRDELLAHRERQEYYRKMFRGGYNKKWESCVCVDPTGNIIAPDALTHKFGLLLKRHGLRHIRFHDLRHSCASLLVANGVPIKMVQLYMGHSNYSTTADIYAHLSPEALDASAACMESLLVPKAAESSEEGGDAP